MLTAGDALPAHVQLFWGSPERLGGGLGDGEGGLGAWEGAGCGARHWECRGQGVGPRRPAADGRYIWARVWGRGFSFQWFQGARSTRRHEGDNLGKWNTKLSHNHLQSEEKNLKKSIVLLPNPDSLIKLFLWSSVVSAKDVSNILANKINSPAMLTHPGSAALMCEKLAVETKF